MITNFQTAFNVVFDEPFEGDFSVTGGFLYTYSINHNFIMKRNSSFSSPPRKQN